MDQIVTKYPIQETPDNFVEAMAAAAFSVSIVTTIGKTGRFGLTVSAVSSVSAEPPLLLACINRKNLIADAIAANQIFAVNLLSEEQAFLAKIFAGRPETGIEAYDFNQGQWEENVSRGPLLQNAAANFLCRLETFHDAGTHRIFIGRVIEAHHNGALPLVYSHRKFGKFLSL
jgi:flavin reductase (DIM6/NTAB) family NADH-FMN oxidoreductase RutF